MAVNTAIPLPPRVTGDDKADLAALHTWVQDFHRALIVESRLADPSFQGTAVPLVPTALPDPAATSIASAQNVANAAYRKAFGLPP
jgi:hypothetical protein